ncbi:MAG: tetratricopeptide repeat protein [Bryobacterales bacterium]|nr:tetratricopeptide repeat protein [Bryobacterales bacterium]
MASSGPGGVFTFYSFSGGTGRSSAAANIGCRLARNCAGSGEVLLIDWSLEAPSLHLYFPEVLDGADGEPGLLDLFLRIADAPDWAALEPESCALPTGTPGLSLLKAGRFDSNYYAAASGFHWQDAAGAAPALMARLRRRYRYILIDSRSGINDLSGLCAMMLPDKLVTVFAPSRASVAGACDVVRLAAEYRRTHQPDHPLTVYPLPSRIDVAEPGLPDHWRFGDGNGHAGYQDRFEQLFAELFGAEGCDLGPYFAQVTLPYSPRYAFGEGLVTDDVPSPLGAAYAAMARRLAGTAHPWEDPPAPAQAPDQHAYYLQLVPKLMAAHDREKLGCAFQKLAAVEGQRGHAMEARAYYAQALSLFRQLDVRPRLAALLAEMGRFEARVAASADAAQYLNEAEGLSRHGGDRRLHATVLAALGDLAHAGGRSEEARSYYRDAADVFRELRDHAALGTVFTSLAAIDRSLRRPQAEIYFQQAVECFRAERDGPGTAAALHRLADYLLRRGRLDDAGIHYSSAAELYRAASENTGLAQALQGMAEVDLRTRKLGLSEQRFEEAISLLRASGDLAALASALHAKSSLCARQGRLDASRALLEEAIGLFGEAGNQLGIANGYRSLGDLDRRAGRTEAARTTYGLAMDLFGAQGHVVGQANTLQSLGDLDRRSGNVEGARSSYRQAIQLYRTQRANLGMANALKSLGDLEADCGAHVLAFDHYNQAIDLYGAEQNAIGKANALQSMGDLLRAQKRYLEAEERYREARGIYETENNKTGLAYTLAELARVAHALCDFALSVKYLEQARETAPASTAVQDYLITVERELRRH